MGILDFFRGPTARKNAESLAVSEARSMVKRSEGRRRNYDAASAGRRANGWNRSSGDANASSRAIANLRSVSRDIARNNPLGTRAVQAIANNTVGWGITPRGISKEAAKVWKSWAGTTRCDAGGRINFYAMQRLAMKTLVQSGEIIFVRHRTSSGVKIQALEPDYIDTTKDSADPLSSGKNTIAGVEIDELGAPVAYWLFLDHPGKMVSMSSKSVRVPASDVIHVYRVDRPGQVRGIPWLHSVIVRLHDFDDYTDAKIVRQKIAACFAVFIRDINGEGNPIGLGENSGEGEDDSIDALEPGMVRYLKPGEDINFASPPGVPEGDVSFTRSCHRSIAAGLGITYEDLTGDYSQVNFSSARMGRIAAQQNVTEWRYDVLIPQLCDRVYEWFFESMGLVGNLGEFVAPTWTPPPTAMIDPEKEGIAHKNSVRSGAMTPDEMVAEMGYDPETHWQEYAANMNRLDELGIVLDIDARKTSGAGLSQQINEPAGKAPVTGKA